MSAECRSLKSINRFILFLVGCSINGQGIQKQVLIISGLRPILDDAALVIDSLLLCLKRCGESIPGEQQRKTMLKMIKNEERTA